jgi:hypothetical protein
MALEEPLMIHQTILQSSFSAGRRAVGVLSIKKGESSHTNILEIHPCLPHHLESMLARRPFLDSDDPHTSIDTASAYICAW